MGGLSGNSTCTFQWAVGADRLQRGKIWSDEPGICDLTSAPCESLSEGRRRFLRALSLRLKSESGFYQRDLTECREGVSSRAL